jgi:hypothetical protein
MAGERAKGLAAFNAKFEAIPNAAQEQLGVELAIISRDILAMQRRAVPKGDTGALEQGLSIAVLIEKLRARIGLLKGGRDRGKINGRTDKGRSGGPFYGRIVNFGRKAQTVIVTRTARRKGKALPTRGARKAAVLANSYSMKVPYMAPREFIQVPGAQKVALGQLAEFWSRTLARTGIGA